MDGAAGQAGATKAASSYAEIPLAGSYALRATSGDVAATITLPGDVHTALLDAGLIPDPYWGANEDAVAWVYRTGWVMARDFTVPADQLDGFLTLTLSEVDTVCRVLLNGKLIAETDNQFIRHDIDVTGKLQAGRNTLRLEFAVVPEIAQARAEAHPFVIPYAAMNQKVAHLNFIRKTACHAGWDWGICLMPIGVYGRMALRRSRLARIDSVQVEQHHAKGSVELVLRTRLFAFAAGEVTVEHVIDGQRVAGAHAVTPGENLIEQRLTIANPQLWWPAGQGGQPLYDLLTTVDGETVRQRLGLRRLDWVVEKDAIDASFKCRVNGRDITAMGANWIPADAIPSRITPQAVRDLLESAVAANQNMIRVWGGGQYEPDWFYDLCDELGLLVWHDLMFSCMPYPSDPRFLASVETEITQQVRRLSHHASIALWCGDNEVIGSLTWYPETKANRDRHLANYDRLSRLLGEIVGREDPARRFWPSSPSLGYMDFADGWHVDTRGDMHFWDVWHSAKPFEHYRTVKPRFASEFGFQSFPSMDVIECFAAPEDRNPSSPVMEVHQRNDGGNARILETMCRYFRFPKGFEEMVFLSQIQQGLAIKTAVEFWRSTKPRSMGTLYWQLNDTWPVASWSSLDHGGGWKLLHAMARRFYAPIHVVAVPESGAIHLRAINDSPEALPVAVTVHAVTMSGTARVVAEAAQRLPTAGAVTLATLPAESLTAGEFLAWEWHDADGTLLGESDFFPRAHKYYDLPQADVTAAWDKDGTLTLSTDSPAFFVTARVPTPGYFSDNAITLLPGRPRTLRFTPRLGATPDVSTLREELTVSHLRQTFA